MNKIAFFLVAMIAAICCQTAIGQQQSGKQIQLNTSGVKAKSQQSKANIPNNRNFNPSKAIPVNRQDTTKQKPKGEKLHKEIVYDEYGTPTNIRVKDNVRIKPDEFFRRFRGELKITEHDNLQLLKSETDWIGTNHYRYQQYYKGVKVDGVQYIVHEKEGRVISANGSFYPGLIIDVNPSLTEEQALDNALDDIDAKQYQWESDGWRNFFAKLIGKPIVEEDLYPKGELVISPINGIYKKENMRLAWKFDVLTAEPFDNIVIYVDAHIGEIINRYSNIQDADVTGSAQTLYSGSQSITALDSNSTYWLKEKGTRGPSSNQVIETYDAHTLELINSSLIELYSDNDNIWQTDTAIHAIEFSTFQALDKSAWYTALFDTKVDLYFKIYDGSSSLVYTSATYDDKELPITIPETVNLNSANGPYTMQLWDYDAVGSDDYITTVNLKMVSGKFVFNDGTNKGWISFRWGNPEADVHWGIEKCYDYYYNTFSRNSWDDNGLPIPSFVHANFFQNEEIYFNAFCLGPTIINGNLVGFMAYGDGGYDPNGYYWDPVTSLDVTAHEFTHGIIRQTAGLEYQNESGALNEGFADIFGALIEHENKPNSTNNWLMGEEFIFNLNGNPYMRNMANPKLASQPDTYGESPWYDCNGQPPSDNNDKCGVHTNSGVLNKWFYLITNGGSGTNDLSNSYTVQGLGWDTTASIAYSMLTGYLTPNSDYSDAVQASYDAAIALYPSDTNVTCQLQNAWYAVGLENFPCNNSNPGDIVYCSDSAVTTFTAATDTFGDGSGIYNYGNNSDCWWQIQPEGADSIDLVFTSFNTEQDFDSVYVYFYDYNDATWYYYGLTGNLSTPFYVRSTSGIMYVNFKSDGTVKEDGFEAYYYIYGNSYCSGTSLLTSCSGSIADGSGGNNYGNNANCSWLIQPAGGTAVTLNFSSFNTESGYDSVNVYDVAPNTLTITSLLGSYSGNLSPFSVSGTEGAMYVEFKSDYAYTYPGFSATYSATCNPYCSGTTTLTDTVGYFEDGSDTADYYNNSYCTWLIQPPGADSVTLNFTSFNTEEFPSSDGSGFYDGVRVYDGTDTTAALLLEHDGNTIPASITSSGGSLFVEFSSDYIVREDGWEAYYVAHIPPVCNDTTALTALSTTFNDGTNSTTNYNNLSDCYWLIQPTGASSIQLTTNYFTTEANFDGVIVFDGATSADSVLAVFTGDTIPPVINSTGGSMLVYFTSDGSITNTGWEMSYVAMSNLSASIGSQTDLTCYGSCSGDATASVSGGNTPYSYNWSDSQTTQTATSLCAGSYTVTVTDTYGYTSSANISITQPDSLSLNFSTTDATCGNSDGSATVSVSGGTTGYTYSWSSGGIGSTENNLPAGTYSVTVTDANSCTKAASVTVIETGGPTASIAGTTAICEGESTTLTASGGISYSWNTGATTSSITVQPVSTTTYTVTVSDGVCDDSASVTVNVNPLPSGTITANGSTDLCAGESVSLTATSGFVSYSWSSGETTESISVNQAGSYSVTITDNNGCTAVFGPESVTVNPNPTVSVTVVDATSGNCDGGATANTSGGTSPYLYQWDANANNQTTQTANNLCPGSYSVTVTDANGCTGVGIETVGEATGIADISFANSLEIYPNPNDGKFTLSFNSPDRSEIKINLYDVTGRLLFVEILNDFQGKYKSEINVDFLTKGIYHFQLTENDHIINRKVIVK